MRKQSVKINQQRFCDVLKDMATACIPQPRIKNAGICSTQAVTEQSPKPQVQVNSHCHTTDDTSQYSQEGKARPWTWVWTGFLGGLFVGLLLQDAELQRALWLMLPTTLAVLGLNEAWQVLLVWGALGATAALLLHFLRYGVM
jgi:hypothetical protein